MKYEWNIEKIKKAVEKSINYSEVLDILEIPRQGNNTKTLKAIIEKNNIDVSHFTGRSRTYSKPNSTKASDYFGTDKFIQTIKLKEKLFKEGYKENKCEICGITEWQNKPINCQLHHIDGNNKNNSLENLQILCPNCHSQTDNYCGNANSKRDSITKEKIKKIKLCPDCGKEININSKYCSICSHNHKRKIERPTKDQLIEDFKKLKTFTKVGAKYETSDNNIKKWCNSYGIPKYAKEILKYIEDPENYIWPNIEEIKRKPVDYDKIIKLANLGYCTKQIVEKVKCSSDTVLSTCKRNNIKVRATGIKLIGQYDLNNNYIQTFYGSGEAQNWLLENNITTCKSCGVKIGDCCREVVKTAYGYIWKYLPEPN